MPVTFLVQSIGRNWLNFSNKKCQQGHLTGIYTLRLEAVGVSYADVSELLSLSETGCCFVPVNYVPECFDVVWAAVLEFQVVSMFPNIQANNREA
ncbi:hypothetical protein CH64_2517 [Yersinia rohdei]|uniref:Uncharacterized protein n=1 Tax=Yersinia rohdei TaxID=29485 RepID=A0ABN4F5B2_YERRO|nr:hypothetical protein CH64_2517 [Yersinia rohdei]CNI70556.1 Uncharacterised protein [Yersinia rohdei]CQJ49430.1 Uncharacterised protein [Yersinia rohdei]